MSRNILLLKRPASVNKEMWKTGLPIGNGITGALVFGAVSEETIIITRHDLWHARENYKPLPDVSFALEEMRKKIDGGDYHGARNIMYEALGDRGYPSFKEAVPFPLGSINLNYQHDGLFFKGYRRGIDMERGYAFVKWQDNLGEHEKRTFISRDDGILYYNIKSDIRCSYTLSFGAYDNRDWSSENEKKRRENNLVYQVSDHTLYYCANVDGQPFGAHIKVEINDGGNCRNNGDTLFIESADFTVKLLSFAKSEVDASILDSSPNFDVALEFHAQKHSAVFNKVSIELTDDNCVESNLSNEELLDIAYEDTAPLMLYEKLWRFGRYLFVSAWNKDSNPFPLYGLWAGTYDLPWNCHVCNENVEMLYWHVLSGDLAECLKNLIHYYYEKLDECRDNAKKLFGFNGIYIPTYTTPETLDGQNLTPPTPTVPVTLNWISGAGWLSLHFYQYYLYTHDKETLNSEIIPFMLGAAEFYEDYLLYDKNGKCKISPSISPENTPANLLHNADFNNIDHPCPVTVNSTMDMAILKNFMTHLLELVSLPECEIDLDSENITKWQNILSAIPEYMVNRDGAIKEWLDDSLEDNYEHRHFSHLFPIFPGNEISPSSPQHIIDAFFEAADRRLVKSQSGWSFAHLACIWTRFGQGNRALESLATMAKSCIIDNFFTLHNDWRHMGASMLIDFMTPVQLDALMGTVNAIQDMLVQYNKGALFILPARPDAFNSIRCRGIKIPDGKVDVIYHGGKTEVSIMAERDVTLAVYCNNERVTCNILQGQIIKLNF
ncbi:MAG: glycoside hydrolase N-terminal domain-containing protein [Clostridia bacterium]|nr:glycoside hydrolase N-terminal domain-containing protein [Clostridia bacterium]